MLEKPMQDELMKIDHWDETIALRKAQLAELEKIENKDELVSLKTKKKCKVCWKIPDNRIIGIHNGAIAKWDGVIIIFSIVNSILIPL